MKEEEARTLAGQIRKRCKDTRDDGIWYTAIEEHRPDLELIKIQISIKIDKEK